ncbi:MAG: hypothetical protein AAFU73_09160 [Planctomycetota bacterium]
MLRASLFVILAAAPLPLSSARAAAQEADAAREALFGDVEIPELDARSLDAWLESLQPTRKEAAFESIPWRSTFAEGLEDATAAGRPLLLWVMNGHPLGCT